MPRPPKLLMLDPFNFVPHTRTPWGGKRIPELKAAGLGVPRASLPTHVGESWEVSTDASFPSRVTNLGGAALGDVLREHGAALLGPETVSLFGQTHCPLLLKWLHADDVLSVQLHPGASHPQLGSGECGKPESWLVLEAEPGSHVYLGLAEGASEQEVHSAFTRGDPASVLFRYHPRVGEILSVPPGLVHALGPGLLLAEPQFVLPGKTGKTWRLSDWNRRYDDAGMRDPNGKPRELHVEQAFSSIDWGLPRGTAGCAKLVVPAGQGRFTGNNVNPFSTCVFTEPGEHRYDSLEADGFSLVTVFAGTANIVPRSGGKGVSLRAGESAFLGASARGADVFLSNGMEIAKSTAHDSHQEDRVCSDSRAFGAGVAFFGLATDTLAELLNGISQ